MSIGAVRIPIGNSDPAPVRRLKGRFIEIIDDLDAQELTDGEAKRLRALAQTAAQEASMWAAAALMRQIRAPK